MFLLLLFSKCAWKKPKVLGRFVNKMEEFAEFVRFVSEIPNLIEIFKN